MDGVEGQIISPLYVNSYLKNIDKSGVTGVNVPIVPKTAQLRNKIIPFVNALVSPHLIKSFNPDIVHETYFSRKTSVPDKVKRVVTVFDMIHERLNNLYSDDDPTSEIKKQAVERADHIICISKSTRNDLLDIFNISEKKVTVIYLGYEMNINNVHNKNTMQNSNKPYLLFVGNRGDYKNFSGLLTAYSKSSRINSNFNLVCFGGGRFNKSEISLFDSYGLNESNIIHVSGDDNVLSDCYKNADAFICPSLYEGFGLTVLEAISLSCPVICSNTSSIPEVVGNAGEYFDPNDTDSIISAIENVVFSQTRKNNLIKHCEQRSKLFSWEKCAEQTLNVYQSLI